MRNITALLLLFVLFAGNSFPQKTNGNPIGSDTGYIVVDGGKLYYETSGKGENIILIHDGMIHSVIWDNQFYEFAKTNKVIRYDRRGYGKSPSPNTKYSNIDDLDKLFIQLKIDKAILFGMSAGGGLAIDFTLKHPEKVTALVLVGAVVSGYGYTSHMATRGGHYAGMKELRANPEKYIRYWGWEDPYEIYPGNITAKEKCLQILQANPQNINDDKYRYLSNPERPAVKHLAEINVPALVLTGEFDIPDVHAHSGVISAGIPNAKRDIISNAAHLVPFEQPEEFNSRVIKFCLNTEMIAILTSQGASAAFDYYQRFAKSIPGIIEADEDQVNALGYNYLGQRKIQEAIEIFTFNTMMFPKSANSFDSLGEAYMNAGNTDLAIRNYGKSLELNPQNTNAAEQLKKIQHH